MSTIAIKKQLSVERATKRRPFVPATLHIGSFFFVVYVCEAVLQLYGIQYSDIAMFWYGHQSRRTSTLIFEVVNTDKTSSQLTLAIHPLSSAAACLRVPGADSRLRHRLLAPGHGRRLAYESRSYPTVHGELEGVDIVSCLEIAERV